MNAATYAARLRLVDTHRMAWSQGAIQAQRMLLAYIDAWTHDAILLDMPVAELQRWNKRCAGLLVATASKEQIDVC
jgi:hypothetical protein